MYSNFNHGESFRAKPIPLKGRLFDQSIEAEQKCAWRTLQVIQVPFTTGVEGETGQMNRHCCIGSDKGQISGEIRIWCLSEIFIGQFLMSVAFLALNWLSRLWEWCFIYLAATRCSLLRTLGSSDLQSSITKLGSSRCG